MTSYRGKRIEGENIVGVAEVEVFRPDVGSTPLPMSELAETKSPDGFEWGYGGSGPAALAHSILSHFTSREVADRHFQQFSMEHIATLDRDADWTITHETINTFLESVNESRCEKPGTIRTRELAQLQAPETIRTAHIITTVQVEWGPGHAHVHVWNRGGKAGTLCVDLGDGEAIAELLLPKGVWVHRVCGVD